VFIEEDAGQDNSVVALHPDTMEKFKVSNGTTIILIKEEKPRIDTVCIVSADETVHRNKVRMNKIIIDDLRTETGRIINIRPFPDIKTCTYIRVDAVFDETIKDFIGNVFEILKRYFLQRSRPVRKGNIFLCGVERFQIVETVPEPYCLVTPDTVIHYDGQSRILNQINENQSCKIHYFLVLQIISNQMKFKAIFDDPVKAKQYFDTLEDACLIEYKDKKKK